MKRERRGKGFGSRPGTPHQRTDGRWEQWITFEGKRYKRSGDSKREVQDKITALLAELRSPERRKARELGPTLAELCEQVLAKYDVDGATHRVYMHALIHWRRLLGDDTRRAAITYKAVQAAVDELAADKTPKTIETYYAALRVVVGADHPALKDITLPKDDDEDEEPSVLVPSDLADRLQAIAQYHPMGIAIGLGLGAGTRAGEATALRWQDVDFTHNQISINGSIKRTRGGWVRGKTKNRKTRIVTLDDDRMEWLAQHRRIQVDTAALAGYPVPEFVIADPATGQGVNRTIPVSVLRFLLAEICTPEEFALFGDLRYHALRHTHISRLLSEGAGVADVARRAGHTPATLLRCYAHAIPGADLRLAELAGELFPVSKPEANHIATLMGREASQRSAGLTVSKANRNRSEPQKGAGSAPDRERSDNDTRPDPQEPAPVSNPLSNPEVQP